MYLELLDVEDYGNDHVLATVDVTGDDGLTVRTAYVFPKDTLEWRAAEYGLDPADTQTLLDIVLFEPHIQIDPDWHLYSAPTVDDARDHLLDRVQERKAESDRLKPVKRQALRKGERPVHDRLVDLCHMDPEVIAVKQELVGVQRQQALQVRRRDQAVTPRAAKFQGILKEMKNAIDTNNAARASEARSRPGNR
jgi:hypothetical protein